MVEHQLVFLHTSMVMQVATLLAIYILKTCNGKEIIVVKKFYLYVCTFRERFHTLALKVIIQEMPYIGQVNLCILLNQ